MKKMMTFLMASMMVLALTACGGNSAPAASQSAGTEQPTASTSTTATAAETKDLPDGDYKDAGNGTMYISTPDGTSENNAVPVLFVEADDSLIQIGLNSAEMDGSKLSYIYVDGMLNTKEQLADSQITLDLQKDALATGTHKVEVVQYDNDQPDGKMVTYKAASYEVKNK